MSAVRELAEQLRGAKEDIVDRWNQACDADAALDLTGRLTRAEFRDNIPSAIEEFCRVLASADDDEATDGIDEAVSKHGHHRWKQGFSLIQLVRDWGHLNQVLISFIEAFCEARLVPSAVRARALHSLAAFMTEAVSSSVRRFDELRQAQAASLTRDLGSLRDEFERVTQARSQMLREAAHDIRGGLSAVVTATDVLKLSAGANESFVDVLDALDRGVASVSEMLESLLDLSRLEAGVESVELLSVDIAGVLRQLADRHRATAAEKGLELRCSGPHELLVKTDPNKVRRIAQNLLVNALQHTTQGEVALSWSAADDRWVMQLADTGPGIQDIAGSAIAQELDSPDLKTSASSASLSYTGEGIGLAIVKRLCEMLDAGVLLDSTAGRGTTIRVEFPLTYPDP